MPITVVRDWQGTNHEVTSCEISRQLGIGQLLAWPQAAGGSQMRPVRVLKGGPHGTPAWTNASVVNYKLKKEFLL
jgi:hypothetical protein